MSLAHRIGRLAVAVFCVAATCASGASYNTSLYLQNGIDADGPTADPTTNANGRIRYQFRKTDFNTGSGSWMKFEWNSWNIQVGSSTSGGDASVGPTNDVRLTEDMRFRTSGGGSAPNNIVLSSIESTNTYVINLFDSGTVLDPDESNDALGLSISEVNHKNALVTLGNLSASNTTAAAHLVTASSAESANSVEEVWIRWSTNQFINTTYSRIQSIVTNSTYELTMTSSVQPGVEIRWQAITAVTTSTNQLGGTTGGAPNFDAVAINMSTVMAYFVKPSYRTGEIVDEFMYSTTTAINGQSGGTGWSNSWTVAGSGTVLANTNWSDATPDVPRFADISSYPAQLGNRVFVDGLGANQDATLRRGFAGFVTGRVYMAAMVAYRYTGNNKYLGMSFMNGNVETGFVGKAGGNTLLAIDSYGGTKVESGKTFQGTEDTPGAGNTGNVYILIGKYDFSTRQLRGLLYERTNSVPANEPAYWAVTATVSGVGITRIDGIRLAVGGFSGDSVGSAWFDEVRVSTNWAGLLGTSATYEWTAGGGTNRDWSNEINWTGDREPDSTNFAYINGGATAVVSQASERAADLNIGSTNTYHSSLVRTGRLDITSGDLVISTNLWLGKLSTAAGALYVTNSGSLTVSNALYVGDQGVGTLVINNSASVVTRGNLVVGNAGSGSEDRGSSVSMTNGTLNVAGQLRVAGDAGTAQDADGAVTSRGGAATVTGDVVVADNSFSTGRVTVAGGTLGMSNALRIADNAGSHGTLRVHGGTVRVGGLTQLGLANTTNAFLVVTGGTLQAVGNIEVGATANNGAAGFMVVSGGVATAAGAINLGNNAGSTGTLTVVGGEVRVHGQLAVGSSGAGTLNLSGGSITTTTFRLSDASGATGLVNVTGGRLVVTNQGTSSAVFDQNGAALQQSGGVIEVDGLEVGDVAGALGEIRLSGGTLTVGRKNATASDLQLGNTSGATGAVYITGGVLDMAQSQNDLRLGDATSTLGLLAMGGGTANVSRVIAVGSATGSRGAIYITNGLLQSTDGSSGGLEVGSGSAATGRVEQSGGRVASANNILIPSSTATSGWYGISGGTLTGAAAMTIGNANGGSGTLDVVGNGGTIHVGDSNTEDLTINARGDLRVTFVSSALTTIKVSDDIILNTGATLTISNSGSLAAGTYMIVTSLNSSAIGGTAAQFGTTNWYGNVTGSVVYGVGYVAITIYDRARDRCARHQLRLDRRWRRRARHRGRHGLRRCDGGGRAGRPHLCHHQPGRRRADGQQRDHLRHPRGGLHGAVVAGDGRRRQGVEPGRAVRSQRGRPAHRHPDRQQRRLRRRHLRLRPAGQRGQRGSHGAGQQREHRGRGWHARRPPITPTSAPWA
jgi:T5SS/PEP-CTERM-associated repeat protein